MFVWVQRWYESERGWGKRPDGFTVHLTRKDIDTFMKNMRAREREIYKGAIPDCYSNFDGKPYQAELDDDDPLIVRLEASECGVWGRGHNYPDPIEY